MADNPDIWTALKKIDELRNAYTKDREETIRELADLKRMIIEKEAGLEKDIDKLEKASLLEGFGVKQQVTTVAWRVALIVSVGLSLGAFILKDIHVSDLFGGKPAIQAKR